MCVCVCGGGGGGRGAGETDSSKLIKQARGGVQIICNESTTVHVLIVTLSGVPT